MLADEVVGEPQLPGDRPLWSWVEFGEPQLPGDRPLWSWVEFGEPQVPGDRPLWSGVESEVVSSSLMISSSFPSSSSNRYMGISCGTL